MDGDGTVFPTGLAAGQAAGFPPGLAVRQAAARKVTWQRVTPLHGLSRALVLEVEHALLVSEWRAALLAWVAAGGGRLDTLGA